jgi:hypothetical protein
MIINPKEINLDIYNNPQVQNVYNTRSILNIQLHKNMNSKLYIQQQYSISKKLSLIYAMTSLNSNHGLKQSQGQF